MTKYLIAPILFIFVSSPVFAQTAQFEVGVLVPLSGPVAEYGVAIQNGIQMAIAKNSSQFKNCNFIFEDTEYKSPTTITAFNKLVEINKVSLAYVFGGPMGEVLAPIAETKSFPLLVDHIEPTAAIGRQYVSRYANSNFEYGERLANYLIASGVKTVSIVKSDNQYLDSLFNGFKEAVNEKIKIEVLANISSSEVDFKFLMPKVKKMKSDAIGVFLLPGQLSTFAKTFSSNMQNIKIFGGDFLDSETEVIASNGVLEGAVFSNNVLDSEFRKEYFERYKNQAQLKFGAEGYDVANLIADKFCSGTVKPNSSEIIDKLYIETEVRNGAQGETRFVRSKAGDKYWSGPLGVFKASKNGSTRVN